MAIDQSSSNTTRHHSVPDSADFDLPNDDWTWLSLCYPTDNSNVKYIVSTGGFGETDSFNLYTYGTGSSFGFSCRVDNLAEQSIDVETVGDKWYIAYVSRRSGSLYVGAIDLAGLTLNEDSGLSISAAYASPNEVNIGRRQNGTTTRYWNGRWAFAAFIDGHGLTQSEATQLASGAPLLSMSFAPNIVDIIHGRTANDASFSGIIRGHVATRVGTSWGTDEEDTFTPYTGSISMPFSVAAVGGFTPKGVFNKPFSGPFGGPI